MLGATQNLWCQYDDNCNDRQDIKLQNISYDRINLIEENTNYEFTTQQKFNAELEELGDIATNELNDAVSQNWSIIKYTPAILLAAGVLVILSYSNKKVFVWMN